MIPRRSRKLTHRITRLGDVEFTVNGSRLIGEGIPLVAPQHRDVQLRLRSARKYPDGVVRLGYDVAR